jgi:hypothetical protein
MTNEVSIFKNRDVAVAGKKAPSALTQSLMKGGSKLKRISPRNGMFVRVVNGETAGKFKAPLRVVLVGVAPAVQRTFYVKAYDPNAEATPPDCWTNDGNKPDVSIKNPQGKTCETCPQNIKGSGQADSRACRFKRRVAVILPEEVGGNNHGDIYQLEVASKSIFGKGSGQTLPLNAYIDYIIANGENIDGVITEVDFNEDNNNQSILFRAVDFVASHPDLQDTVDTAVESPDVQKAILLNVTAVDKGSDSNEEFEQKPKKAKVVKQVEEEEEEVAEPVKRAVKKPTPPAVETSLADVVSAWSDD